MVVDLIVKISNINEDSDRVIIRVLKASVPKGIPRVGPSK